MEKIPGKGWFSLGFYILRKVSGLWVITGKIVCDITKNGHGYRQFF
jgi:hypothetical protein